MASLMRPTSDMGITHWVDARDTYVFKNKNYSDVFPNETKS